MATLKVLDKGRMGFLLLSLVPSTGDDPCEFHRTCLLRKHFADGLIVGAVLDKVSMNCINTILDQFSGRWPILQCGGGWLL
jgi:hypothetical protein